MTPEEARAILVATAQWRPHGDVDELIADLLAEREALLVALGGRPVARGSSFSDTWHGCHDEDREAWVVPDE